MRACVTYARTFVVRQVVLKALGPQRSPGVGTSSTKVIERLVEDTLRTRARFETYIMCAHACMQHVQATSVSTRPLVSS